MYSFNIKLVLKSYESFYALVNMDRVKNEQKIPFS